MMSPKLTVAQRLAGQQIYAKLMDRAAIPVTARPPTDPGCYSFLPRIEEHRSSSIYLLDGSRNATQPLLEVLLLEWVKRVRASQGSLAPVAQIDLRLMPPGVPYVLPYISGCLERIVGALEGTTSARLGVDLPCRYAWRGFWRALTAWDGNLQARAPHLDPDYYAVEMAHAMAYQRGVFERFGDFGDALVADYCRCMPGNPPPPIFIVAGDVPNRYYTGHFLYLLSALRHSRIVWLLTGRSADCTPILSETPTEDETPLVEAIPYGQRVRVEEQ